MAHTKIMGNFNVKASDHLFEIATVKENKRVLYDTKAGKPRSCKSFSISRNNADLAASQYCMSIMYNYGKQLPSITKHTKRFTAAPIFCSL